MDKIYKEYYRRKRLVIEQEKTNNSKIILFPSPKTPTKTKTPTETINWMKIGGTSALIYKYYIAPRLDKKPPKIAPDKDFGPKFKTGIISIRDKDTLIKNLKNLGYQISVKDEITTITIKTFTQSELTELKNRANADKERANALIKPSALNPEIYINLVNLARALPYKTSKITGHKELTADISATAINLLKVYVNFANGNLSKDEATRKLKTGTNNLCASLIIANELNLLDFKTSVRLGETISNIKTSIKEL